jgi:hypothetical protein
MIKVTKQTKFWSGKHGDSYMDRNPQSVEKLDALYKSQYRVTRKEMDREFLDNLNKDIKVLSIKKILEATGVSFLEEASIHDSKDLTEKLIKGIKYDKFAVVIVHIESVSA